MASWLLRSSPDRAVRVRALAGDIVLCTLARHFNAGGNPAMDYHPFKGGVEILLVASRYRNRDKVRPDRPLGSYADLTYLSGELNAINISSTRICLLYYCLFCPTSWVILKQLDP